MCANYFSCIHVFAILWTVARQTLSIGQSIEINPGCGGRDSDGFGWGSVPVVLPGSPLRLGTYPIHNFSWPMAPKKDYFCTS